QGFQTFSQDPKTLDESLALIFGDLSPSSASAHMNYLITLLKSSRLRAIKHDVTAAKRGRSILRTSKDLSITVWRKRRKCSSYSLFQPLA
ncbi:hypothetical protein, partial [Halomonas sp. Mc5H-6]|uniref:hypothetical protein n=1 Tax=Halomonas sp. Mc5H-6 TaxID=2954500 RepID=UPI0020968E6E